MGTLTDHLRRTPLAVTAITLSMVVLAGCSGGDSSGDTDDPATGSGSDSDVADPVDLRMTVWTADETQLALFDDIGAAYVAAYPDRVSSVTFETLPFENYTTALTTQVAGGNPPGPRVDLRIRRPGVRRVGRVGAAVADTVRNRGLRLRGSQRQRPGAVAIRR